MTPDELQRATGEVEKQASKLNEELTQIIADGIMHRFEKYGEVKLSASDEYRIKTLKRAGATYNEIMQAIQTKTKGLNAEIKKAFKETATNLGNVKTNSYVQKKVNEPIKQNESGTTVKRVKTGPINEKDLTPEQKRILEDVYRRTQNEITDFYGKTAYNGVKVYQQAVDEAIRKIQTGIGWQKAVRDAIKEVAKKGMYVEYPSGRIDTIETAILRAVRTGVNQANSKLVLERAKAEGQDFILVSSHMDARPTHQVWQGKMYSISGSSKKYPEFYSTTGYGTAEGLCGINCRHTIMIYYPGVTRNPFKRYNSPANRRRYEISQKQRKMERDIRKTRNRKNVLEASKKNTDDPELKRQLNEEIQKETNKLRQQKQAYDAFVESNQLKKAAIRTYTPKYDAAELKKAVKAYRKEVIAKSSGGRQRVYFDDKKSYRIELEGYSQSVNDGLSKAAIEVARLGSDTMWEHCKLVNLKTGEIEFSTTDHEFAQVGGFYKHAMKNPTSEYAFIHNHNTPSALSLPDMQILAGEDNIKVVAAVRNDGIITLVESNGKMTTEYLNLYYEDEIKRFIQDHKEIPPKYIMKLKNMWLNWRELNLERKGCVLMVIEGIEEDTNVWDIPNFEFLAEYPFVKDDMTWGEYIREKKYFGEHYQDYRMGTYKPLWKQKEEKQ